MTADQEELVRALYDAHGPALVRFATRMTGDHALAQDVVQEALLRAWRRPEVLEQSDESARRWLFTVVRNLVIDDRRTPRHTRVFPSGDLPEVPVPDQADQVLDAWLLSDALASLSLEHRTAVVSSYYLGHTIAEIAHREGVPEGTVKSRLHYALRALRLALQERGVTR